MKQRGFLLTYRLCLSLPQFASSFIYLFRHTIIMNNDEKVQAAKKSLNLKQADFIYNKFRRSQ